MKKAIRVLALLVLGATAVSAQMHIMPSQLIDGSTTPEQIPDIVAFRLWLTGNPPNEGPVSLYRMGLHLPPADAELVANAVKQYQAEPAAQHGAKVDWQRHYGTVRVLWTNLQTHLSPDGLTKFQAYLQKERGGMKVSSFDYGLGAVAERNLREVDMVAGMPQQHGMIANYSGYFTQSIVLDTTYYDTFQRPNGPPGGNWVTEAGSFQISNHQLAWVSGQAYMYYNTGSPSTTANAEIQIGSLPTNGNCTGVAIRMATNAHTDYTACLYSGGGIYLYEWLNGTYHLLASAPMTAQVGDTLALVGIGSNIQAIYNGVTVIDVTNSDIASGYAGIDMAAGTSGISAFYSGNGYLFYQNGSVSGTTTCNIPSGCNLPGVTHTGHVANTISNLGSTFNATPVPYQNYLSAQNPQWFPLDFTSSWWDDVTGTFWVEVICSSAGPFYSATPPGGSPSFATELAITNSTTTVQISPGVQAVWCSPQSTPPDWGGLKSLAPEQPPYFPHYKANTLCSRWPDTKGTPWHCLGIGAIKGIAGDPPVLDCTNADAGIHPRW